MANIEFEAISVATDIVNSKEKQVILKAEQELAVKSMLEGKDVLAVLLTGFGKSMIFTVFGIAKKNIILITRICSDYMPTKEYSCRSVRSTKRHMLGRRVD